MCRNWRVGSVYLQCYVPETLPRNAGRRTFDRSLHGEGLAETEAGRSHNANTYYKHKKNDFAQKTPQQDRMQTPQHTEL